jgi:maltose-binding protein MalE
MEPDIKKALMIAGIVLFTVLTIHIITNTSVESSSSNKSSKTVVVHDNNPQRYYYGFNEPVHRNYNPYKAQYYN